MQSQSTSKPKDTHMTIGTRIDYHDPDIVQDGETVHVPMMMRDSLSPLQRAVIDGRAGLIHTGDGFRPGFVMLADASARDAAENARTEMIAQMRNAWKGQGAVNDDQIDDVRPMLDAAEAERRVADARNAWISEMQNAWKS
jgi:hypothetical protein